MLKLSWDIVWVIVNLLVLFFLLRHFLYNPVMKVIQERQDQIDRSLSDAEQAKQSAEEAKAAAKQRLDKIETEAEARRNAMEAQARKEADDIVDAARSEAADIVAQGKQTAQAEHDKMLRDAKDATADLACTLAGKLIVHSVTPEDEKKLLDDLMQKVGEAHE